MATWLLSRWPGFYECPSGDRHCAVGFERYKVSTYYTVLIVHLARKLRVPVYELLGGKVRNKLKVYAWIGGDRPSDILEQAYTIPQQSSTEHHVKLL
jgi:hypothetical protein